jgi:hypothetical protein
MSLHTYIMQISINAYLPNKGKKKKNTKNEKKKKKKKNTTTNNNQKNPKATNQPTNLPLPPIKTPLPPTKHTLKNPNKQRNEKKSPLMLILYI